MSIIKTVFGLGKNYKILRKDRKRKHNFVVEWSTWTVTLLIRVEFYDLYVASLVSEGPVSSFLLYKIITTLKIKGRGGSGKTSLIHTTRTTLGQHDVGVVVVYKYLVDDTRTGT